MAMNKQVHLTTPIKHRQKIEETEMTMVCFFGSYEIFNFFNMSIIIYTQIIYYKALIILSLTATDYHATPLDWKNQFANEQSFDSSEPGSVDAIECPTSRNSVLALAVTCSLLVILYVCTVMCMCYRKAYLCSEEDDDRCSTSTTKSTMLPEAILRGLPSPVVPNTHGRGGYIPNSRDYMR